MVEEEEVIEEEKGCITLGNEPKLRYHFWPNGGNQTIIDITNDLDVQVSEDCLVKYEIFMTDRGMVPDELFIDGNTVQVGSQGVRDVYDF